MHDVISSIIALFVELAILILHAAIRVLTFSVILFFAVSVSITLVDMTIGYTCSC